MIYHLLRRDGSHLQVCNFIADCPLGEDERFCVHVPCRHGDYSCGDGQCIEASAVCNKKVDCLDLSDEDHALCYRKYYLQSRGMDTCESKRISVL